MSDWPNKKAVHLAKHLHKLTDKQQGELSAEETMCFVKYDGVYSFIVVENGAAAAYSRTGKRYTSVPHIEDEFEYAVERGDHEDNFVAIVELWEAGKPVNYISGKVRKNAHYLEAVAVIHDVIPLDDFRAGECNIEFMHRLRRIKELVLCTNWTRWPRLVSYSKHTTEDLYAIARDVIATGEEGIIVRRDQGTWKANKRDWNIIKIKQEESFDLEVTGVAEDGKGKYAGFIGGIIVRFRLFGKDDGDVVEIKVSGMSDTQRKYWTDHPDAIIGKIVKVDAMGFTQYGMLREPRFKEVREDKLEADL